MEKLKKILSYSIYWLLQCTWGFIMTFMGAVVALIMLITGHKPHKIGPTIYFNVGEDWGGMSLGGFFFCDNTASLEIKYHECGHSLQNIILGPLMPFIVCIPSAARYWLFQFNTQVKRSTFALCFLFGSLALFTLSAWLMTFTGIKALVIACEILRLYFILLTLWLNIFQLPQFEKEDPDYDSVWFEECATKWGTKVYEKKEG